ncbi:MAG: EAL domain-containing protein [Acidaminococcaceae bacterium]|nr:EAL domain-containing protein [Acidaminococcaceae bacterium]
MPLVISAGFCNLYGIAKEEAYELMSHNMYRDIHPDDKDRLIAAVSRFATEDVGLKVVYRIKTAKRKDYMVVHIQGEHFIAEDGERLAIVWYTSEGFYSSDDEGESALARSFNVMLREETMIRKTSYDALTGLPTMANFFKLVETARGNTQEKDTKKAIVYFDFCGMTAYNSKYGYAEGDRLIQSLSELLARYFGNENCSRFAQDNFAAYTNANDLEATLKKLFKECLDLNGGKTLPVRAGIYVDDEDGVEIGVACDRARMACNVNQRTLVSVYEFFSEELLEQEAERELENFRLTYINRLTELPNFGWFEKEIPEIIKKTPQERKAGKFFIIKMKSQRLESLKSTYDRDQVVKGIVGLMKKLRVNNPWVWELCISSEMSQLYLLGCLPDGLSYIDAAAKLVRDGAYMEVGRYTFRMNYSAGIALVPATDDFDIVTLMNAADTARVAATDKGETVGIYDEQILQKKLLQKNIDDLAPKALDNGEFIVWLQPKYDLIRQETVGAEALVRWQSPELGFLMPASFIDLFEKNGFIIDLDYYMLEQAFKMQRQRLDAGKRIVPVSVNQSGLHLSETEYLQRMREMVGKYGLPAGSIDLEITETAFVDFETQESRQKSTIIVDELRSLGFTVSMDDFCTGYSSIMMLQSLSMDVMKIDRAMLLAAESSERGRRLLCNVINMGKSMEMKVLCEGIERREQEVLLIESGCKYGQGFLYKKPMPAEDFFRFLDSCDGDDK